VKPRNAVKNQFANTLHEMEGFSERVGLRKGSVHAHLQKPTSLFLHVEQFWVAILVIGIDEHDDNDQHRRWRRPAWKFETNQPFWPPIEKVTFGV